ncbi:hypothetical protein Vretimale_13937 [Volvox reticuliferus]|uniref:Uncharacterized protein n=1 Tax=Volvox reticuliferus TaxID=1737510 RepID=A0A8J4GL80_9CHLO|nr:hypothetical protein Vretifemale_17778 [Volvox reticuliferus]GIM10185.1 hypothetical protein Vretimale_13937 [Volvox reticuliferus]
MRLCSTSNPTAFQAGRQSPVTCQNKCLLSPSRKSCQCLAQNRATPSTGSSAPHSDVFVLDFDGVVVDSEPEITASAFEAAALRWPELFSDSVLDMGSKRAQLREAMRMVRPVLVRGFESMVMLRMLSRDPSCPKTLAAILNRWSEELPRALSCWGESSDELTQIFEAVRNDWMTNRTESWMALQVPYTGVVEALGETRSPIYIASSKAAHRVSALSSAVLGLDLPSDSPNLFASLLPPEEKKAEALGFIAQQPCCASPETRLHFVDDRLDTLLAVKQVPELAARWNLYLADWGYNTAEERAAAAREPGIKLLELGEFNAMLAPRARVIAEAPRPAAESQSTE